MSKFTNSLKKSVTTGALGTGLVTAGMTPDHGNPMVNLAAGAVAGGVAAGVHKFMTYNREKPQGNRNLGRQFK